MGTFVVTYSIVWLAVALYVVRLGFYQRRLIREMAELETWLEKSQNRTSSERTAETAA